MEAHCVSVEGSCRNTHGLGWVLASPSFCLKGMCFLSAMGNLTPLCSLHLWGSLHLWRFYFVIWRVSAFCCLGIFFFFSKDIREVWFHIIKPKVIFLSNLLGNHSVYAIPLCVTWIMQIVNVNHGGQIGKDYGLWKCSFTLRIVLGWRRKCKSCPFTLRFYIF